MQDQITADTLEKIIDDVRKLEANAKGSGLAVLKDAVKEVDLVRTRATD